MKNVVLTRIDDRLIHGQVMTAWVHYTNANKIVIVDDGVAADTFLKSILKVSVPPKITLDVFDVKNGAEFLKSDDNGEKIIILIKTPNTFYSLLEEGVELKKMIIGGMGATAERKKFYKNISASEDEKDVLRNIINRNVDVSIHIIPDDNEVKIDKLL